MTIHNTARATMEAIAKRADRKHHRIKARGGISVVQQNRRNKKKFKADELEKISAFNAKHGIDRKKRVIAVLTGQSPRSRNTKVSLAPINLPPIGDD